MRFIFTACVLLIAASSVHADSTPVAAPVPDVKALLLEARAHQKQIDKIREDYTYRQLVRTEDLDGKSKVKKTDTLEQEVFFVKGHEIQRLVRRNGKDLTPGEQKKEQDHVNKELEKASKVETKNKSDDGDISVSRILEIITIQNPRRIAYKGRSTIAFDFIGDPHAKTHGMTEDISKILSGTVWIDEKDREVARMEAHISDNFHVGGGLLATVQKGSNFTFEQIPVNGELWLPASGDIHFSARVLLLKGLRQNVHLQEDHYQKFHADAMQQPGTTTVLKQTNP